LAVEFTFDFPLPLGLHARPAAFIQERCQDFEGEIVFENLRNGRKGEAKSILSLITSDTQYGDLCRVAVSGQGEKEFAAALKRFLVEDLKLKEEKALERIPASTAIVPRLILAEKEIYLTGQPASPGIVSGKVFLLKAGFNWESLTAGGEGSPESISLQAEKEAFSQAVSKVQQEIQRLLPQKSGVERNILQAHLSIITDRAFIDRVNELITKEKYQAKQAVYQAGREFSQLLGQAKSQYLRERMADIQDVTGRLLEQLGGQKLTRTRASLNEPAIIVAEDLFPSEFLSLNLDFVRGLILDIAGQTSHTLIMARSQAIPAVTGVTQASRQLRSGEEVILDGTRGVVVISPGEAVRRYYQKEMEAEGLPSRSPPAAGCSARSNR